MVEIPAWHLYHLLTNYCLCFEGDFLHFFSSKRPSRELMLDLMFFLAILERHTP